MTSFPTEAEEIAHLSETQQVQEIDQMASFGKWWPPGPAELQPLRCWSQDYAKALRARETVLRMRTLGLRTPATLHRIALTHTAPDPCPLGAARLEGNVIPEQEPLFTKRSWGGRWP